ncbi:MAG: glycosyltransferase family 4 protein, partial [Hyphomicrobiaceae bacterium]|nr:glycosyltransferase family 4 protein [Hyphomicrobiaceae bacterium]
PLPLPGPSALAAIRREVRAADAVLLHDSLYPTNVAARMFAAWYGRPTVIIQHIGTVPYSNPVLRFLMAAANRVITRPMLSSAHKVAFISEITRRHFASMRWSRQPVLVFNGVDTATFNPGTPTDITEARQRLALPTDRPVALFVGRFVDKKGLHLIERIARREPGITFALAGWGTIDPLGWGLPNVRVLSGLSGDSLAEAYRASDVFLLPSTGEGLPLVIQEAMACGLPVICGAETATADAAAACHLEGVPIDPANHDETASAFAAALDRVLANAQGVLAHEKRVLTRETDLEFARTAAFERHAFVRDRYSWSRAADTYLEILNGLVGTAARPSPATPIAEARNP